MSDFFREVDEEMRNERMRNLWRRFGVYIIGVIVLIVVGTAAYRGYLAWQESQAAASGDRFLEAIRLTNDGDAAGAQRIMDELAADGTGKYPMLAQFRSAALLVKEAKNAEAVAAYDALSKDGAVPTDLQDFATLQAGLAAVDVESFDAVKSRLGGLVLEENPWRNLAREALALSAWRAKQVDEAARLVAEVLAEQNTPQGLRPRIQILRDLIISSGGTLPDVSDSG
ncbi:MAG: tetratricopeptide repeat protein [Pseudomonadota bacterium]